MIEVTEAEMAELKLKVFQRIEEELVAKILEDFKPDRHNIKGEVRNQAVKMVADRLVSSLEVSKNMDDLIEKTLRCAEARVSLEIKARLAKGIKLSLGDL